MKKLSLAALVGGVAILVSGLLVAPAQAYPQAPSPHVQVKVQQKVVVSGASFVVRAKADVRCDWKLSFLDQRATRSAQTFTQRFTAPTVHRGTTYQLRWTCSYSAGVQGTAGTGLMPSAQTESGTIPVTVTTARGQGGPGHGTGHHNGHGNAHAAAVGGGSGHASGGQPATSSGLLGDLAAAHLTGPAPWLLLAGLVLLAGGGATMVLGRRRRTAG